LNYLVALIFLILPAYLVRFSVFGIPTTVLEVIIYLVFAIGLILFFRTRRKIKPAKIWLPAGLLLLAAIISVWVSPLKISALGELKAFFIDPLLVLWLMLVYLSKKDFRLILGVVSLSALFVSFHAIWQYLSQNITPDGRVIGIFGYSPNYLALFLAPITALFIGYSIENWQKNHLNNFASLGASAFYLIALYLSGSRAGLLVVLAGLIAFSIFKYWSKISSKIYLKISLAVFILIAVFIGWFFFKPNFSLSPENGGRVTSSNNIRWQIWGTSLELGRNNPVLGLGLGNFQPAFTELTKNRANFPEYISPWALTPHNLYLMFWLSTGILGIGAFIWILVIFYQQGFKLKTSESAILLAGMTALLLQGLVDTPYFKNDLCLIFWCLVGLVIILNKE